MSYAERWKSAREAAGFTVQQAAESLHVHRNTIYRLEQEGTDDVTLRMMEKVAAGYGVTLGYVFADESAPERIPSEFRPLLEPLMPMTKQQREQIIRNVAASLSFMSTIYGVASHANVEDKPLGGDKDGYHQSRPTSIDPARTSDQNQLSTAEIGVPSSAHNQLTNFLLTGSASQPQPGEPTNAVRAASEDRRAGKKR